MRRTPSGRFVLRLTPGLHAALRSAAAVAGVSLNDYCARKLAAPGVAADGLRGAGDIVARALAVFGPALRGVIVHGSFARGEASSGSDVDVLVVVGPEVPLTRASYREWDGVGLAIEGRPADIHFAHIPPPGGAPTALWAEVALEGVILFERDLAISRALTAIRRRIAAGQLVRRMSHGQPYWVEAT